jgi:methylthioribulose-1-phosphate dehydratase
MHSEKLRESLSWVIQDIHGKGWATGTGGNFSAVLQRDPLVLLMAPSGVDKGFVQPQDLIEVDRQGQVIGGEGKASAETLLHLAIVQATQTGAVLHTHSVLNTILSELFLPQGELVLTGYEMLKGLEGIRTHEAIVKVPILPNCQDMEVVSEQARSFLPTADASDRLGCYGFLLAGHGLYTWGETLFQARRHLEILEFLFEVTYRKLMIQTMIPTR